jgi:TraB/PrgY/gumN family
MHFRYRKTCASLPMTLLGILCAAAALSSNSQSAESPKQSSSSLDEILVTGTRPGPGLWRVSKGDHELWILATLVPLPKNMTWRSQLVGTRIANSQLVLAPPEITADVGFFQIPKYAPALVSSQKIPDEQTLDQIVPHDLYIRWLSLRGKYFGNGHYDEHTRPMLVALHLYQHALDQFGLTSEESVWRTVEQIAAHHRVRILPVTIKLRLDSPEAWIHEFNQVPRDQEVECLEKTIERLETDLLPMGQRANMWSVGDIDGLRAAHFPDDRITCFDALFSVARLHSQLAQAEAQLTDAWLAAADDALDKNSSSFAVLPIGEVLAPDGWLAKLRARGYAVRDP